MSRFSIGETKVRPGVYFRETTEDTQTTEYQDGVVAVAFKANWGALGKVVTIKSPAEIYENFGDDSETGSNVNILHKIFKGGASEIKAVRVGAEAEGTKAAITLKDTASTAANVVTLTAKYAGTRPLTVTIKDSLAVTTMRECIIYSGTREITHVQFAKGDAGEVDALVAAINGDEYSAVVATKVAAGNGLLAAVNQTAFTTAGASPAITSQSYGDAMELLEAASWQTFCVDSNDTTVHALVSAFIERVNDAGLLGIAVIGEPSSVSYATRKSDCAAFNACNVVYCLNGFTINGEDYEGWAAAAVVAGLIAYLPSSDSVTHKVIPDADAIVDPLTNTKVIECLQNGALVFTMSSSGNVWVEQGINTLTNLSDNQDAGWKKIRRTKCRFELITRISEATENAIGSVNNDSNGRLTIIALANGVINEMIAEGKLLSGEIVEDSSRPASGDSAWFVIRVIDLDSIEKVYLTYYFQFGES